MYQQPYKADDELFILFLGVCNKQKKLLLDAGVQHFVCHCGNKELLRGCRRTSLAVQKANCAVKMHKSVGFEIVDENECTLWSANYISKSLECPAAAALLRSGRQQVTPQT